MTTSYRHPKALPGETYEQTCARLCAEHGEVPFGEEDKVGDLPRGAGTYAANSAQAMARAEAADRPQGDGTGTSSTGTDAFAPTPKQVAFLGRLAAERGLEVEPRWLTTKATASQAIDDLLAAPAAGVADQPAAVHGATPKQQAFVTKLAGERGVDVDPAWLASKAAASEAIDKLMAMPKAKAKVVSKDAGLDMTAAYLERGTIHVLDGDVLRVHHSQTSGYAYAVRATIVEPAVWGVDEDGDPKVIEPGVVEWDLLKGAIYKLTADTVATAAQSAAFGKLAGKCVYCGRNIDTKESTAVGYGPVCAGKYGLPWGDTATPGAVLPDAP
jgi:hypothetical protein